VLIGVGNPPEEIREGRKVPRARRLQVVERLEGLAKRRVVRRRRGVDAYPGE
jgi:hypothetical protein